VTVQAATAQLALTTESQYSPTALAASSANKSLTIHRWANWIAGFSGGFVSEAIRHYLPFPRPDSLVMDPFAGVGTTLIEAQRMGINSIGVEINPFAALVCRVKLRAEKTNVNGVRLAVAQYLTYMEPKEQMLSRFVGHENEAPIQPTSIRPPGFTSRIPFFSSGIEQQVLFTLEFICGLPKDVADHFRVALASVMVDFSNYSYEPSLGSRPAAGKNLITTASVCSFVSNKLGEMADDICEFQQELQQQRERHKGTVYQTSIFNASRFLNPSSVDLIVTSPPYMNNYHYVRNTRPHLYWINLISSPKDTKKLEGQNFGKFWQTVRAEGPIALGFSLPELEHQIAEIRTSNTGKGVYGGEGWANYVVTYMNDSYRFCGLLTRVLKPGGVAVIVVGNSVVQGKEVRVEEYLEDIGAMWGLERIGMVRLRNRVGSSIVNTGARLNGTEKHELYDAAVVLRRPR
jgi:DNA modification methylase